MSVLAKHDLAQYLSRHKDTSSQAVRLVALCLDVFVVQNFSGAVRRGTPRTR